MDPVMMILRIIHIFAGVFWVGSAFFFFFFLQPTAQALGPAGGRFVTHLVDVRRFATAIITSNVLVVASGAVMYWIATGGLDPARIGTPPMLVFGVGAIAGIAALVLGAVAIGPTVGRLTSLGKSLETAGVPPTAEQVAELESLGHRLRSLGKLDLVLLTVALLSMATARYWG